MCQCERKLLENRIENINMADRNYCIFIKNWYVEEIQNREKGII